MDFVRETPLGDFLRAVGIRSGLLYPEDVDGFLPADREPSHDANGVSIEMKATRSKESHSSDESPLKLAKTNDPNVILVDWYGEQDTANPRNWSSVKKAWVTTVICLTSFVVYCSSAIFVASNSFVMLRFGVSEDLVAFGMSLFVLGYGVGPMIFSPLSEIAYIGRNPPYVYSTILFVIVSVLLATIGDMSFAGMMTMRFLQGFFGSPVLASGGASLLDVYDWDAAPYAFVLWIASMYCGPAFGPFFATQAIFLDWRWPLWQICIMTAPVALCAIPLLPETSPQKILYLRAQRLRKQTGNQNYKSETELVKLDAAAHFLDCMIKPTQIAVLDPAISFCCIYGALLYATYYSFFEAFLLVYIGIYKFAIKDFGLIFLCVVIGCVAFAVPYALYVRVVVTPQSRRTKLPQEARLKPALPAAFLLPASLFMFAWTAREDVHWIVPTIGLAIFTGTSFVIFQCILCYVPTSYPDYTASLLAANDFARSVVAVGFIHFSIPLYKGLGVGKGVSILGGISIVGAACTWALYLWGDKLRARSKFAVS